MHAGKSLVKLGAGVDQERFSAGQWLQDAGYALLDVPIAEGLVPVQLRKLENVIGTVRDVFYCRLRYPMPSGENAMWMLLREGLGCT